MILHDEELEIQPLFPISREAIGRSYDLLGEVAGLSVYERTGGVVAGYWNTSGDLSVVVSISSRDVIYPAFVKITEFWQISMVRTAKGFQESKFAFSVYDFLARRKPLISDSEQYLGAQGLWKSLASRSSDLKVYLYDDGKFIEYDGSNIPDSHIWGMTFKHRQRLLVASVYHPSAWV